MRLFKKILDFLFGKDPEIFDEKGNIAHRLPQKQWDAWNNKYKSNPEYNWRQHSGTRPGKARH